jgi:nucleotide-binding universal stress UspA family protein
VDLVVVPHRHERSIAAFFRGQPVMRLIRKCIAPVLVARANTTMQYHRILVAVDFASNSAGLATLAANVDPQAELLVFHAIDTRNEARLRAAEATEQAVSAYRDRCLAYAHHQMRALARPLEAHGRRVVPLISHGDPGQQAVRQREQSGADLVIVGKNNTSAWQDFFFGSVAHSFLSWGSCDVLVVPDAYLRANTRASCQQSA